MNFLRRLFGGRGQGASPDNNVLHLYVRCQRCGAPVHVRVHLYNDLAVEYDENENVSGYRLHKEMMDSRCFRLIYADVRFDRNRRELERSIEGGEFVSEEEYSRLSQAAAKGPPAGS
jgi:hypothetical protein